MQGAKKVTPRSLLFPRVETPLNPGYRAPDPASPDHTLVQNQLRSNQSQHKKNLKPERDSAVINMTRYIPDQGAFLVKSPVYHCIRPLHRPCPAIVHPESR